MFRTHINGEDETLVIIAEHRVAVLRPINPYIGSRVSLIGMNQKYRIEGSFYYIYTW